MQPEHINTHPVSKQLIHDDTVVDGRFPDQPETMVHIIDRYVYSSMSQLTKGVSPGVYLGAYHDWLMALGLSPGKRYMVGKEGLECFAQFLKYSVEVCSGKKPAPCIEPLPQDHRFNSPGWQRFPFNLMHQAFLGYQIWCHNAVTGVPGMTKSNERIMQFITRQMLDTVSPSNGLLSNPDVIKDTLEEKGENLARGTEYFLEDMVDLWDGKPEVHSSFEVGKNIAITEGKVIYRNRLMELIQYSPTTDKVHPEPVLIVSAWIMKYYILDLQSHNSMIKFLLDQGHTVFAVSWHNPSHNDRNMGMEDYRQLGIMAALEAINAVVPDQKIHATGYCLGGTLLSIAAAYMAKVGDDRLASLALFAAQTDFKEAGELTLFTTENQIAYLENLMWSQGYLDGKQMAGAFQMLRSNDLLWSKMVRNYMMGQREPLNDLMTWNTDTTRMPYRMHSEYLRTLFLNNEFAEGHYRINGRYVTMKDVHIPIFVVGTEKDHVAPWKSVYKVHLLSNTDITFVLTSGGHNAGIVSEPGHPRRHYQVKTTLPHEYYASPDRWRQVAEEKEGSWWPTWHDWLAQHSGNPIAPPTMGTKTKTYRPIAEAPGTYVLEK